MLVPGCGCCVELATLDRHVLDSLASVGLKGEILAYDGINIPCEPICLCGGSLQGVNRYAGIFKMAHVHDTIDRLLAKMGRRLDHFGRQIHRLELSLVESWDSFCSSIRPNPVAARENARLIGERSAGLLALEKDIIGFRGKMSL